MKQTAVEWMVEKLFKPMDNPPIENVSDIIERAKEMEKKQIIDAWLKGVEDEGNPHGHTYLYGETDLADKYYNETFKNK